MRALVLVVLLGCGPGLAPSAQPTQKGQGIDEAIGDVAKLETMLQGSVTNGGLWFEDAACAAKFQVARELSRSELPEFARCLVGLGLKRAAREDSLGDVVVMTYGPGFEIEARVVQETEGARLAWIGFVARRATDVLPTISATALETLRVAGDRNGPLDHDITAVLPVEPNARPHVTWFKLCIDETGTVESARPYQTTSIAATKAFERAITQWRFRPFALQGQPMPVCSMVQLAHPPKDAPTPETIPLPPPPSHDRNPGSIVYAPGTGQQLIEGKLIKGEKLVVPDDDTRVQIQQSSSRRLLGTFRVCIDETGHVESLLPLRSTGYARYDRRILGAMTQWEYSPYLVDGRPVPVCTGVTFIYTQR